jgi:Zn finger protein HypA/HybF involved in hydrogenase expression
MISCECGYSGEIHSKVDAHSPAPELEITCPSCGGLGPKITSGRELEIVDVKLQKK